MEGIKIKMYDKDYCIVQMKLNNKEYIHHKYCIYYTTVGKN